jgi:hypothetical protein
MRQLTALAAKHHRAIEALLEQPSVPKAAEASGVARTTLYRWMRDPMFSAAYYEARKQSVQQTVGRIHSASWAALQVLLQLMADPKMPPTVRFAAAAKILDLAIQTAVIDDLQRRLEVLEAYYEPTK